MLILATSSQTFHSYFPLFDVHHLKIANCPFGQFWASIRSCHEDLILTRKSHNCSGIAFIQVDSAGGSNLIEQTIISNLKFSCFISTLSPFIINHPETVNCCNFLFVFTFVGDFGRELSCKRAARL